MLSPIPRIRKSYRRKNPTSLNPVLLKQSHVRKIVLQEHILDSVLIRVEFSDGVPNDAFVIDKRKLVHWMREQIVELEGSLEERKMRALEEIARKMDG